MNAKEIQQLATQFNFKIIETHISWVLLGKSFVYKIKKPEKFNFLDFSTLDRRRFYCEQELVLNQRLAKSIYLEVVPIFRKAGFYSFTEENGKAVAFALKMKRLPLNRQMDLLLENEAVQEQQMQQIARQLIAFHQKQTLEGISPDINDLKEDFSDLNSVRGLIQQYFGGEAFYQIDQAVKFSNQFLEQNAKRIAERAKAGFWVDGHGDLHSGNIFLLEEPVIFDCIEFSPNLRKLDILNELAFLCMDLEAFGHKELATYFIDAYNKLYPIMNDSVDQQLFLYYKWYRSNVRLKINALKLNHITDIRLTSKILDEMGRYFSLFNQYYLKLQEAPLSEGSLVLY